MSSEGYLVDVYKLYKIIVAHKRQIFISTISFLMVGVIIAFTSRTEYTIEIEAIPLSGTTKGGLSGMLPSALSALGANVNLSVLDNPDIVSTSVYPDLLNSKPFKLELLKSPVKFERPDTTLPLSVYLEKYQPFSLPGFIVTSITKFPSKISRMINKQAFPTPDKASSAEILTFDRQMEDLFYEIDKRIRIKVDQVNNLIKLTIKLPDKKGVANLGKIVIERLNDAIISYKIQKAKNDAEFIEKRYNEAYAKFVKAQMNLSAFRDQNKSIITASAKAIEERLVMEFNIAYNVCNSLALQLEQAQIKIQENKPVLQIIDPPYVPNYKSGPKRILIIVVFSLLGFVTGCIYVVLKNSNLLNVNINP